MPRWRAISMVEVMFSISLLLLIILTVGSLIPNCYIRIESVGDEIAAVDLTETMLGNIRSMRFEDIETGTFDGRIPTAAAREGTPSQFPPHPYPQAQSTVKVTGRDHYLTVQYCVESAYAPDRVLQVTSDDLKLVTVSVFYETHSSQGITQTREVNVCSVVRKE